MSRLGMYILAAVMPLSGYRQPDNLSALKDEFLQKIYSSEVEEGPFSFDYRFRTIFFSKDIVSLFGELTVQDRLPHGWKHYEGKTLYRMNGQWKELALDDLFQTDDQKEKLRITCENNLKRDPRSYDCRSLTYDDMQTFVLDDQRLIIIFQPCVVGAGADGPFQVKIPLADLKVNWATPPPFFSLFDKAIQSREFTSSWDLDEFYERLTQQ